MRKRELLPIIFFCLVYLLLTITNLNSGHHVLFNLEPYPDGLMYTLSARNLAQGHGLQLSYHGSVLPLKIPLLYPLFLAVGYLFFPGPQFFYISNVLLGLASLVTLFFLVKRGAKSMLAAELAVIVYLSHAYIFWLPSLAMAENLALFLFLLSIYFLFIPKIKLWQIIFGVFLAAALVFTKYSLVGVSGMLGLFFLYRAWKTLPRAKTIQLFTTCVLFSLLFVILKGHQIAPSVKELVKEVLGSAPARFYSFQFMGPNIWAYTTMLLGQTTNFLWSVVPLTTAPLFILGYFSFVAILVCLPKKQRWLGAALLGIFISQFAILSIFYVTDARYILYSVPLIAIGIGWLAQYLSQTPYRYIFFIFLTIAIGFQLIIQKSLFQQIISANLFGRSEGWQYRAVQHFNAKLPNGAYVITALPPFFVDAYGTNSYRTLPLSPAQEFISKNQMVWGSDIDVSDLNQTYRKILQNGQPLFVTNAYVTNQKETIQAFEDIKRNYKVELIESGCLETCNIYQIRGIVASTSASTTVRTTKK